MAKLALVVFAIVGFLLWLRFAARRARAESPPPPLARDAGVMLACAHCGVLFPGDDAITDDRGLHFCCVSHRDLGPGSQ